MFYQVNFATFIIALDKAQSRSDLVKKATTPCRDIDHKTGNRYYLSNEVSSKKAMGFAISETGELTSVYSLAKGQGDTIMKAAIALGAKHLDCFDGYLVEFYKKHGFREVDRMENWTPGEPDVVLMELVDKEEEEQYYLEVISKLYPGKVADIKERMDLERESNMLDSKETEKSVDSTSFKLGLFGFSFYVLLFSLMANYV